VRPLIEAVAFPAIWWRTFTLFHFTKQLLIECNVMAGSQSLERGLRILTEFVSNGPVLGISAVDLNRSTTHRYVATLTGLGFLQQDPDTREYSLGPRVADLSGPLLRTAHDISHELDIAPRSNS
jgi:hypothetical protein